MYLGEMKRKLKARVKEHKDEVVKINKDKHYTRSGKKESEKERWSSAITDHTVKQNHVMDWTSAQMVQKESNYKTRGIKEVIWIRKTLEI